MPSIQGPLKPKTLSTRVYGIVIFIVWSLAILVSIVFLLSLYLRSNKAAVLSWMSFPLSFLFIVCACNIVIWRKVRKRNVALQQQNRAASQNQRLTNALLLVSAISVLSWLPLVIVNYLIPIAPLFVHIVVILNLSNSILNPFVYALRIPEFRQALRVSRPQEAMDRPGIEGEIWLPFWSLCCSWDLYILIPVKYSRPWNKRQWTPSYDQTTRSVYIIDIHCRYIMDYSLHEWKSV